MASRKPPAIEWGAWVRSFGVWFLGLVGVLVTFYFTTKATLDRHEAQFTEIAKKFDGFTGTLKDNYSDYAKNQKEEAAAREKVREQFMALFGQLSTNSAAVNVKVESIGKALDGLTTKIDTIQQTQRDRVIQEQKRR